MTGGIRVQTPMPGAKNWGSPNSDPIIVVIIGGYAIVLGLSLHLNVGRVRCGLLKLLVRELEVVLRSKAARSTMIQLI